MSNWRDCQRQLGKWYRQQNPRSLAPDALEALLSVGSSPPAPSPRATPTRSAPTHEFDSPLWDRVHQCRKAGMPEIMAAIRRAGLSRLYPVATDARHRVLDEALLLDLLESSDVDQLSWVAEDFDCDDFAAALWGEMKLRYRCTSFFVVIDYSGGHAYSAVLLDRNGRLEVALLEPQADDQRAEVRVGDTLSGHEAYEAKQGFILF